MAGVVDAVQGSQSAEKRTDVANSFIATVYFKQASTLLDQGQYAEAEHYFREVLRIWPDHAGALNNLGTAVWRQKRFHEAERYHRRAQSLVPDDYAILNNLGNVLWELHRQDEAIKWYRRAIKLRPDAPEAAMNFGVALSDVGEFDEASQWIREALRLEPDSPGSHVNLGNLLSRQGDLDAAERCYERALELRPDYPEARRNRSYLWLTRGDFARGWPEHEWRLKCKEVLVAPMSTPRWGGEDNHRRSILLISEQGFGDTLQFIRFAAEVKKRAETVVVACPKPLMRLVGQCPGVDRVADWKSTRPVCDVHAPMLSLLAILGVSSETSLRVDRYLSVDAETAQKWRPIVERALDRVETARGSDGGRILKVGIAWQGNRDHKADRLRSFPLRHFEHLAAMPGVRLISLQKGFGTEQLRDLKGRFAVARLTPRERGKDDRRDFLDTAAVVTQLDLVITPDSSLAHLAGGLGVRVWVPLSTCGEWRWLLDREDSPWYPTMRLFRQTTIGDWDGVFKRMAEALRQEHII
jgi:Flp pilus assembly protein TadD